MEPPVQCYGKVYKGCFAIATAGGAVPLAVWPEPTELRFGVTVLIGRVPDGTTDADSDLLLGLNCQERARPQHQVEIEAHRCEV